MLPDGIKISLDACNGDVRLDQTNDAQQPGRRSPLTHSLPGLIQLKRD